MQSLPASSSLFSTGTSPKVFSVDSLGTFHEKYSVIVLLGNNVGGQFSFDPGAWPRLRYRRTGVAYFCPHCGDIWARLVFTDSRGVQMPFDVERVACAKHPDSWNTAGSLLASGLEALVELLPSDVLKRELELHIKELQNE